MSKEYDVYGMGNALVDIVAEIDVDFLIRHEVKKGLMTLVEEDRQNELLSDLDFDKLQMQAGGSAANSILAVSQFGGNSFYSCKVSNDDFGKLFMKDMIENGVDTNLSLETLESGTTGKCLVMVSPDADRTMNTFLGITTTYSENELDKEAILASNYLYIEGYLVSSPTGMEAMIKAKDFAEKNNVQTSITFSDPSMLKFFKEGMVKVMGNGVDLLFCNEEEAMAYTETSDLMAAREELKKYARRFAITLGANGAMIYDGDTFIDIEPYKVQAIDTNGAGDMFAGAFLYAINHGHSYAEAGKLASLASSRVVSKIGPRLKWHETQDLLNELTGS